ncbi:MAG TPA: hypothetical protein DEZ08_02885 [Dehalococcoidia bacterium]|jgi:hypothetical protein|nr:hypothetical protein [Dehalococcoidia bacterium]
MSQVFKYEDLEDYNLNKPDVLMVLKPWIDVGRVGTRVLRHLKKELEANNLTSMNNPGVFYDYTIYRPRTYFENSKRIFRKPETRMSLIKRPGHTNDLILMELLEPHSNSEELIDAILDMAKRYDIASYTMIGGMYDMVPHTRPLVVSSIVSNKNMLDDLKEFNVRESDYEGPTSITLLVQEKLREKGIDTRTFVVHLPQYLEINEDFSGQARLMEIICKLYNLPTDLVEKQKGIDQYADSELYFNDYDEIDNLIEMLEQNYDKTYGYNETVSAELSPDIEQFLKDMGESL